MRFRIDLKIFIFLILFYFTRQIEIYSFIMLFAFIHELGHLVSGLLLGMKAEKLELMPFGFSISFKVNPKEYNKKINRGNRFEIKKIIVAMAGPLTNFIIILLTYYCWNLEIVKSLTIIYTNFILMVFNLIPIYPLDGGRILRSLLHIKFGKRKAEEYSINVSQKLLILITAITSILILYIKNIAIVFIIIYLWFIVIRENIKHKKRQDIYKKVLENSKN